ncbi:MAG: thioredoxin [Microbacteriaceae bacterium]|nr:thioredoxin [Microbacteriaceae bacterium]
MSNALDVTEATFEQEVLQSDLPVLVDFWAEWCGPCRALAPTIDALAADNDGKLKVVKVNVDDNPNLSSQFRITSIPTLKLFKGGSEVHEIVGGKPKEQLQADLNGFI